jgi:hypothetical protein
MRLSDSQPKWLAWLSFVVALTMLVAFVFVPFLIVLGWNGHAHESRLPGLPGAKCAAFCAYAVAGAGSLRSVLSTCRVS